MKNTQYTDEEDNMLLNEIEQNMSLDIIAKKHQRSISSITTRLKKIAINIININNISFEEASKKVNLPVELLQNYYSSKIKKTKEEKKSERKIRKENKKEERLKKKEIKLDNNDTNINLNKKSKYELKKQIREKKELDIINLLSEIRDYLKILVEK
jgi:hypothetical protein